MQAFFSTDAAALNDPMLLPDMGKAVARLRTALESDERIGIFGDFDTDGITGTALLAKALGHLGGRVVPYLPHRVDEGHGLNDQAVCTFRDSRVSLIVTVDCGTASADEIALASTLGIDTIVTDHHTLLPDAPEAFALINPQRPDSAYPYPHLTGAGMSFKLAEALYSEMDEPHPEYLMELAALGTVADVGPLTGENRYLVKKGLEHLNATANPGIRALATVAGLKMGSLDTNAMSFGLIPRLNVAGRLAHADASLQLLTTTDANQAESLAEELQGLNARRRELTERGFDEAMRQVETRYGPGVVPSIIIVGRKDWVPGILGLIAARLGDQFNRPTIALTVGNDVSRASARSIPEFNLVVALRECGDLFVKFGGHPQAAGFTIRTSDLPEFQRRLTTVADGSLQTRDLNSKIEFDCEISPAILTKENLAFIQSLSPFGSGSPEPVFLTRCARVVQSRQVGDRGQHLKMRVSHSDSVWEAIAFRQGDRLEDARESVDLLYTVGIDTWKGRSRLQLIVADLRPARSGLWWCSVDLGSAIALCAGAALWCLAAGGHL